jgi:UDP-N-acetylglucosamine:LPS N-acetylglucosamine transferase
LAASAGGHLSQLLKVASGWQEYETFFVTTKNEVEEELQKKYGKVYVVGECNRQHPLKVLLVFARCARLIFKERPAVVISTGAAAGCIVCFLAKLFGAKIIWIDSITNVERISLSGRMVRYIADLFLVQWPELTTKYKNVEYLGAII